jgi:hypothetical protein
MTAGVQGAMDRALFVPYDTARFELARIVAEDVFGVPDLALLHEHAHALLGRDAREPLGYRDNLTLRARLAALPRTERLFEVYDALVADAIAPRFGGRLSYSLNPTFRVHLAGTESVSNWHTDVEITGRDDQVNAWLPLVDAFGTNSLWVESDYGRRDFGPVAVAHGEVLLFDGGWLLHGSVPNTTSVTRVSLDFRFAPKGASGPHATRGILAGRPPQPPGSVAERIARERE